MGGPKARWGTARWGTAPQYARGTRACQAGRMVTKHLTKAKFGMEVFKFCLCLSIPGVAVLVFRKPENLNKAITTAQYVVYPKETSRPELHDLAEAARARKPS